MPQAVVAVAARVLTEFARSRRVFALWVLFPTVMLVLFGWVRSADMGVGAAFTSTAPGILMGAGLFFSCLGGPVAVLVAERERRTLRRLLISPLHGSAYFLGVVLAHLAVAGAQGALVYAVTFGSGGSFGGSPGLGAVIVLLSVLAYVGVGFIVAARVAVAAEDINGVVAGIGVPLLVLGGTFFPAEDLPRVLAAIAQVNPIYHMNTAFKAVAAGAEFPSVARNLVVLAALAAAAMALGIRSYRQMLVAARSS